MRVSRYWSNVFFGVGTETRDGKSPFRVVSKRKPQGPRNVELYRFWFQRW